MAERYGALVREARLAARISLRSLAGHLGVSAPYLSDVERGHRGPFGPERTQQVADFLGADRSALARAANVEGGRRYPPELLADWLVALVGPERARAVVEAAAKRAGA